MAQLPPGFVLKKRAGGATEAPQRDNRLPPGFVLKKQQTQPQPSLEPPETIVEPSEVTGPDPGDYFKFKQNPSRVQRPPEPATWYQDLDKAVGKAVGEQIFYHIPGALGNAVEALGGEPKYLPTSQDMRDFWRLPFGLLDMYFGFDNPDRPPDEPLAPGEKYTDRLGLE